MATMKPVGDEVTDQAIVDRSITDPGAFGAIFERHFATIYGYLARRVGGVVADDLTSQTFLVAFDRRRSLPAHEGGALPWLYRIATNLLSNHRRTEQRLLEGIVRLGREPERLSSFGSEMAEDRAMVNIELQETAAVLAALGPRQRDVLLLHLWAGLSYDEMAVALDIPVGTVRSRLSRARQAVRDAPPMPRRQTANRTHNQETR
jgi:RNA polymerase sigma factor (sigma-70 family)